MKSAEIKELTTKEITERVDAEKANLNRMKMNHAVSPLDNPQKITVIRKDIARLMTELSKRNIAEKTQTK
jgi:large subunit ribosomal protein L29